LVATLPYTTRMRWRRVAIVGLLSVAMSFAAALWFQRGRGRPGGGFFSSRPARYATLADFDGSFQFCRIVFTPAPNGDGSRWDVDYPRADENLSIRFSELTKASVSLGADDLPKHLLINLQQPELFHCP